MQKKSTNNIGIIGCGWLGLPLAKALAECGFTINGSTTSPEKVKAIAESGIVPFLLQLDSQKPVAVIGEFLNVDLLIINIPPGRSANSADFYVDKLAYLKSEILKSPVKKIIFISSTSVYAENNNLQTEESRDFGDSAIALRMLSAENVFTQLPNIKTTIIRMAGLIGPERHPGRFFAGKKDIPNGLVPVNLIHLDDCIGIIHKIILEDLWNEVYNGAAPSHPSKMEFYDLASKQLYGKNADFVAEKGAFKIIDSTKIISKGYPFKHPDLLAWLQETHQN
ncbi:MAG TPA: NAD(P)-binding domain-containing protein [Pelobium sp.]|nr:NAD(P)-binding domain-containing protein [Pelobium sp.]